MDSVDSHEFTDALEDITPQATPKAKKCRVSSYDTPARSNSSSSSEDPRHLRDKRYFNRDRGGSCSSDYSVASSINNRSGFTRPSSNYNNGIERITDETIDTIRPRSQYTDDHPNSIENNKHLQKDQATARSMSCVSRRSKDNNFQQVTNLCIVCLINT